MTMATTYTPDHNEQLSRRSLQGGVDLTCSARRAMLVDALLQQALFSVKDAKTEALGGKFHGKYTDDIDFCFGPALKPTHQKYISDSLMKLEDLLDPKGKAKFAPFCDESDSSPGCKADGTGAVSDSWFTSTPKQTDVTLCGSFFFATSHCAYHYRSTTNNFASILVRALGISSPLARERMEKLHPGVAQEYNPEKVNKELSADERVKFYPAWECFLSRRSKDAIITKDACNANDQLVAGRLNAGLVRDEILNDIKAIEAQAKELEQAGRRLTEMESMADGEGRRMLAFAEIPGKAMADHTGGVAIKAMPGGDQRVEPAAIFGLVGTAKRSKGIYKWIKDHPDIKMGGSDTKLNELVTQNKDPDCEVIVRTLNTVSRVDSIKKLHNALKAILAEGAGTGLFDMTYAQGSAAKPAVARRAALFDALGSLANVRMRTQVAFEMAVAKKCKLPQRVGRVRSRFRRTLLPVNEGNPTDGATWTQAEPYAYAISRATVFALLGMFYQHYPTDLDLSGDELMNFAIHRMTEKSKSATAYKNGVMKVISDSYVNVFRVATSVTVGDVKSAYALKTLSDAEFNDLGMQDLLAPNAQGRGLLGGLIKNIHDFYTVKRENRFSTAVVATIPIPASIPGEFNLRTLVSRKKRQEVRELNEVQWGEYKTAISLLQDSGMYAKLVAIHGWYSGGRRIHHNPRFLPWHRGHLFMYDWELTKVMNKPMRAPYWDWTLDSGALTKKGNAKRTIATSALFTPAYFGTWGTQPLTDPTRKDNLGNLRSLKHPAGEFPGTPTRATHCVTGGLAPFSEVTNYGAATGTEPKVNRCLTRGQTYLPFGDPRHVAEPSQATLERMLALRSATTKTTFMTQMEFRLHNTVHDGIGGEMAATPASTSDPIFWSHHAMLDNVWAHWQAQNDGELANQYNMPKWKYPRASDNLGDQYNQGFDHTDNKQMIAEGKERAFHHDDWMVFFGPNDGLGTSFDPNFTDGPAHFGPAYFGFTESDTRKEYWQIKDLLEMRYSFRTFQYYKRAKLGAVTQPPEA